jgi:hypothetical protein
MIVSLQSFLPGRIIGFLDVCMYKDRLMNSSPVCLYLKNTRLVAVFLHRNSHSWCPITPSKKGKGKVIPLQDRRGPEGG